MLFIMAYLTVLLSLSSLWVAVGTWTTVDIYISNRNYPGGPWAYFLATQNLAENVIFIVAFFVLTFLSDFLVVSQILNLQRLIFDFFAISSGDAGSSGHLHQN